MANSNEIFVSIYFPKFEGTIEKAYQVVKVKALEFSDHMEPFSKDVNKYVLTNPKPETGPFHIARTYHGLPGMMIKNDEAKFVAGNTRISKGNVELLQTINSKVIKQIQSKYPDGKLNEELVRRIELLEELQVTMEKEEKEKKTKPAKETKTKVLDGLKKTQKPVVPNLNSAMTTIPANVTRKAQGKGTLSNAGKKANKK